MKTTLFLFSGAIFPVAVHEAMQTNDPGLVFIVMCSLSFAYGIVAFILGIGLARAEKS